MGGQCVLGTVSVRVNRKLWKIVVIAQLHECASEHLKIVETYGYMTGIFYHNLKKGKLILAT